MIGIVTSDQSQALIMPLGTAPGIKNVTYTTLNRFGGPSNMKAHLLGITFFRCDSISRMGV